MPAIDCRHCGRAWLDGTRIRAGRITEARTPRDLRGLCQILGQVRALIDASPEETDVRWLSSADGQLHAEESRRPDPGARDRRG